MKFNKHTFFLLLMILVLFFCFFIKHNLIASLIFLTAILYYCNETRAYILSKIHLPEPHPVINGLITLSLFVIAACCLINMSNQTSINSSQPIAWNAKINAIDPTLIPIDKTSIKIPSKKNAGITNNESTEPNTSNNTSDNSNNQPSDNHSNESTSNHSNELSNSKTAHSNSDSSNSSSSKSNEKLKENSKAAPANNSQTDTSINSTKADNHSNNSTNQDKNHPHKNTVIHSSNNGETVYVTPNDKLYHNANCSHLNNGSIAIHIDEALANGYLPCEECH